MVRAYLLVLIIAVCGCQKESDSVDQMVEYKCECQTLTDTITLAQFSTLDNPNFKRLNAPIDSINALILTQDIQPFEKVYEHGVRKLWWFKGHPIKMQTTNSALMYDRKFEYTFYIFDNCSGASEFKKFNLLYPYNLITHQLFFYENRMPSQLFVRSMTPDGATDFFGNITHVRFAKEGALSNLKLFKQQVEFYGFHYYN